MLPGWIENQMELFINEDQIYNQNLRIKFEKWMYEMKYTMPKTRYECDFRIREFMKDNNIGYKKCKSNSSIKIVSLDSIQNTTVKHLLK